MDTDRIRHMLIVAGNMDDAHLSEEQLKTEFDRDPSIFFCITSRYGLFRHVSIGFTLLLGWGQNEIHAIRWHSLIHPDEVGRVVQVLTQMDYLRSLPVEVTTPLRHKNGAYVLARLYIVGWLRDGIAYMAGELVADAN